MSDHREGFQVKNEQQKKENGEAGDGGVWGKVKGKLAEYLSSDAFSRWFKNAELVEGNGEQGRRRAFRSRLELI